VSAVRFLAKRRFNGIDGVSITFVAGQIASGHYALAAIAFGAGVLISVVIEVAARGAA